MITAGILLKPLTFLGLLVFSLLSLVIVSQPLTGIWLVLLLTPIEAIGPVSFALSKPIKLGLTAMVAIALLLRKSQAPCLKDPYRWPFFLIVASGLASSLLADDPLTSMLGISSIVIFVFYYRSLLNSGLLVDKGPTILRIIIAIALLSSGLCFLQLTSGYGGVWGAAEHQSLEAEEVFSTVWPGISRASGSFNGPNAAGAFFAIAGISCLVRALVLKRARIWFLLASGICIANILTTFSRGALLGCICGSGFAYWAAGLLPRRRLVLLALFMAVCLGAGLSNDTIHKYLRVGVDLASVSPERLDAWHAARVLLEQHPVLGIGYYQFHDASRGIAGIADMPIHPHNAVLKAFLEQGPIGGCAYLWFLIVFVRRATKTRQTPASPDYKWVMGSIAGTGACLFSQELFDANFTMGGSSIAILFASFLAIQSGTRGFKEDEAPRELTPLTR